MIGYNEPEDLIEYALLRGVTIAEEQAPVLLTRSLRLAELQLFKGVKYDPEQPLEFPTCAVGLRATRAACSALIYLQKSLTAQLVCAMIYQAGGDPLAAITPQGYTRDCSWRC